MNHTNLARYLVQTSSQPMPSYRLHAVLFLAWVVGYLDNGRPLFQTTFVAHPSVPYCTDLDVAYPPRGEVVVHDFHAYYAQPLTDYEIMIAQRALAITDHLTTPQLLSLLRSQEPYLQAERDGHPLNIGTCYQFYSRLWGLDNYAVAS